MTYLTIEGEIDNGKIVPHEPDKLPHKGKGLLTVTQSSEESKDSNSQLQAFHELQKSLKLDEAKAKAWLETIRDARQ